MPLKVSRNATKVRRNQPDNLGFEDGRKGSPVKVSGQPLEAAKVMEADSPLESPKRNVALPTPW